MSARTSTPARMNSIGLQSKRMEKLLRKGKEMNEKQFEEFIRGNEHLDLHASNHYWKILAERARIQLEDQLRDNQQLHQLLEELTKENEQLQMKNEQCEYLSNIFNSILSEHDSGIDLHSIEQSPAINL